MDALIPIAWRARVEPLDPVAAVAMGAAARQLARRTLARSDLSQMTGLAGKDLLLLAGADLPWADGVVYLGKDPLAPSLLVPTTLAPDVPVQLLERALLYRASWLVPPLAVFENKVVAAGIARPVDRDQLAAWLEGD